LCDVGSVPGGALHLRALPFAVLLTGPLRRRSSQLVRATARILAGVAPVLAGAGDSSDSGAVPADLLLLSRRLLQSVLGRPAVVHGRRAAGELLGREFLPAHPPERAPLHAVHFGLDPPYPGVRCLAVVLVHRSSDRRGEVRYRYRNAGADGKCRTA